VEAVEDMEDVEGVHQTAAREQADASDEQTQDSSRAVETTLARQQTRDCQARAALLFHLPLLLLVDGTAAVVVR